jgi:hypothetical protein
VTNSCGYPRNPLRFCGTFAESCCGAALIVVNCKPESDLQMNNFSVNSTSSVFAAVSNDQARAFARDMVQAHAQGMEMARRVRQMSTEQIVGMGLDSLAELEEKQLIAPGERFALATLFQAALLSNDLQAHQEAARRARESMGECSPFAELIIGIAEDSISRDMEGDTSAQLPPGAHARVTLRVFVSWVADTAAGSAAGAATAATVVGAVAIGAVVGAAASAAVLA